MRLFAALTMALILATSQFVAAAEPGSPAAISERLQAFVEAGEISGAVGLVIKDGKVVYHDAVGLADIEGKRPMLKDSIFAVASMTKPIAATALMTLVDEKKVAIDDPVSKYIPAFKKVTLNGKPLEKEITIKHLMTHTSGLGRPERKSEMTLAELADAIAAAPLAFEPGTKWQYGDGISVAGRIVEVASGEAFADCVRKRITEPLGMKDTAFWLTDSQAARIAVLYAKDKESGKLSPASNFISPGALTRVRTPNPSGGLFSTAADMGRFYQAILNGGELDGKRIVSKEAVAEMTRLQSGDLVTGFTPGNGWGLGWCLVQKPQGVTAALSPGTFGHGGAFGTQGWVDPQTKTIYVLLLQRTGLPNSDGSEMRKEFHRLGREAKP